MPQFELQGVGPDRVTMLARGLNLQDAVRRAIGLDESVDVTIGEPSGTGAWREVHVAGEPAGRGRAHQRMRFRRD